MRSVYTLKADGYFVKTIIIKSTDYDTERQCEVEVEFEEEYTLLSLEVVTEANYSDLRISGSDVIGYTRSNNILDIKLEKVEDASVNIKAGNQFRDYTVTLNEDEAASGNVCKTIMLVRKTETFIEIDLGAQISVQAECDGNVSSYTQGSKHYYAVSKTYDIRFVFYDTSDYHYENIGERTVRTSELSENDYICLGVNDIERNVYLTVNPYLSSSIISSKVMFLTEKISDEYEVTKYYNSYGNSFSAVFGNERIYTIFTLGGDGKIRYKDLDLSQIQTEEYGLTLEVNFDGSETVVPISAEIIDVLGDRTDFANVDIYMRKSDYSNEYLANITEGNSVSINPTSHYDYIYCDNLPNNYYFISTYKNQDFYEALFFEGAYRIEVVESIAIDIHFDYPMSLNGQTITAWVDGTYYQYTIDGSSDVTINNFIWGNNYSMYYNERNMDIKSMIGEFDNIVYSEGNYSITIDLAGYMSN